EHGFRNAIAGAHEAITATTPEVAAVLDADRIPGLLTSQELSNPKHIINRILPQMLCRGAMLELEDGIKILAIELRGVIPDDESIIVATNRGEPVVISGHTKAAQAYRNIVRRIEGEEVPFLQLEDDGWVNRLRNFVGFGRKKVRGA